MPSTKNILLPACMLALAGLAVVLWDLTRPIDDLGLGRPAQAAPRDPDPVRPTAPAPLVGDGSDQVAEPLAHREKPLIDPALGKGMISGRIAVSTRVIGQISSYTIVVQEDINPNGRKPEDPEPFLKKQTFPANFSAGTPYFDIDDVPFSRHPYMVSVVARGVNGSSARTFVNAETPAGSGGDVNLSLTPGSYFSIRLIDQRQVPRPELPVRMIPVGESLVHRDLLIGTSDRSGTLLFENVVKGDYEIRVGPPDAPLAPPQRVQVYASFANISSGRPSVQGAVVTVPDGHDVTIVVSSSYGYGVEGAELKAWQLEVKRYYEFKGATDRAGRFVFENVPYGTYQLDIHSKINGTKTLKFKVEKDQPAPMVEVTMPK